LEFPLEILGAIVSRPAPGGASPFQVAFSIYSDPGKSVLSEVLYNDAACKHVARFGLTSLAELRGKLGKVNAPISEMEISPFPPEAIIVKAFGCPWCGTAIR
jgi:hypothetical protein